MGSLASVDFTTLVYPCRVGQWLSSDLPVCPNPAIIHAALQHEKISPGIAFGEGVAQEIRWVKGRKSIQYFAVK